MSHYRMKLWIDPKDIYNKINPEQKELFKGVVITKAELCDNGTVEIECIALENDVVDVSYRQKLLDDGNLTID